MGVACLDTHTHFGHKVTEATAAQQNDELGNLAADLKKYAPLLRKCGSLRLGKQIHVELVRRGYNRHTLLGNLLVQMYGKCGSLENAYAVFEGIREKNVFSWNIMIAAYAQNGYLEDARRTFDRMPMRDDVVAWNAMVAGYGQNGRSREAFGLFQIMDLEGIQPTKVTFVSVLDACASLEALAEGKIVHLDAVCKGFHSDVVVGTALVNMYGKCQCVDAAKDMFDRMASRNVVSWTAMLAAYALDGQLQEAKHLFDRMPKRNVISWNAMISAYAQNGHMHDARCLFYKMVDRNVATWNSIIAGYAQNEKGEEALQLFRIMDLEGEQPNRVTFISTFDACSIIPALAEGRSIHSDLLNMGFHLDVQVETSILSMYGRCGSIEDVRSLFGKMAWKNLVSWNTIIAACLHNGQCDEVLRIYHTMCLEGERPDDITFTSVLSACSHAGFMQDGWYHFVSISMNYGVTPTLDHHACMIDLLARAGQVGQAMELIKTMPFEPNVVTWKSLLSACKTHSHPEEARYIVERIFELDPTISVPYVLLSHI